MISKLFLIFCYIFYAGILYTAYVPKHAYLNMIDNARSLYIWVHVPLYLILSAVLGILLLSKAKLGNAIQKKAREMSDEEKTKLKDAIAKMKKRNAIVSINRIFTLSVGMAAYIIMGDHFLGGFILFGSLLSLFFIETLKGYSKELSDAIK